MFELLGQLAALPPVPFSVLVFGAAAVGARSAFLAFRCLRWRRMVEDMPTSRTRSAPQGYIELAGRARLMDGPPVATPMTGLPCVWWQLTVEKRGDRSWVRVSCEQSDALFALEDDVGRCIVDPDGAEVSAAHKNVTTRRARDVDPRLAGRQLRYTEQYILDNDTLFVIGWHRTFQSTAGWDPDAELVERLREWKRDQPALINRFDANNDGRIDEDEWALARREARRELIAEHRDASATPGVNVIGAPDDARPFLIAAQHEQLVARSLGWRAAGYAVAALALNGLTVALLTSRFGL